MDFGWGKCEPVPTAKDTWIKMSSKVEYDLLSMNENHQSAYKAWTKEHCVHLYEHYGFKGRHA